MTKLVLFMLLSARLVFGEQSVDLNRASLKQLMILPGIGQKLAERIVKFREENGPFHSVEELASVPGVSPKLMERIRDQIELSSLRAPAKKKAIAIATQPPAPE